MAEDIVAVFKAVGQRAFQAAVEGAAQSVGHLDKESKQASKSVDATGRSASKASVGWKKAAGTMAKWAGGAAALYAAKRGVEASIHTTEDLAKSTLAVQRATGLDAKQASAWAEVMKSR